eukprot:scaffold3051_cov92-Cylindrotheca_fusiformis.AAC.2
MDEHPSKRLQEATTTTKFQDDDNDDDDAKHQGGAVTATMEETKSIVKAVSNKSPTRRNKVDDDDAALKEQRTNAWNSVCKYVVEVDPSSDFSESSIIMDDNNNNNNEGKTKTIIMQQEKKVTSLGAATSPSPELAPSSNHQNNIINPGAVHMLDGGSSPHQASDREIEWGDTAVLLDAVPVDENSDEHHVPATLPEAVTAIQVSEEEEDERPTGISLIFRNRQVGCIVVLLVIVSVSLAAGLLVSDGNKKRNDSRQPASETVPPSVPPTAVTTLYWNKVDSFDGLDDGQTDKGYRLSMSGDGTVLAASPRSHGTARFFNKKDGRWTEIVNLRLNRTDNDSLGSDVSLSNDGKRVALGSNMYNGTNSFQGKVEIFDLDDSSDGTWTNSQVIIYGDMYNEQSGYSVALSKDGLTLAVGVPTRTWWREQDPEDGKNPPALGHVRVYRRFDASSSDPVQIAGIDGVEKCDFCGGSVALSKDGSVFAFGCPSTCDGIGHVRVFYWIQDEGTDETKGTWKQRGKNIKGEGNTWFGFSIDLSDDGNLLAVGAPKGSYAKVFQWKDGNGDEDEWEQVGQRLGVDVIDFGVMVSLSKPPNSSCVSAILATNDRHNVHTYRLKLGNDRWEELADVLPGGDVSLSSDGRTIGVARNVDPGVITVYDELETACDTKN